MPQRQYISAAQKLLVLKDVDTGRYTLKQIAKRHGLRRPTNISRIMSMRSRLTGVNGAISGIPSYAAPIEDSDDEESEHPQDADLSPTGEDRIVVMLAALRLQIEQLEKVLDNLKEHTPALKQHLDSLEDTFEAQTADMEGGADGHSEEEGSDDDDSNDDEEDQATSEESEDDDNLPAVSTCKEVARCFRALMVGQRILGATHSQFGEKLGAVGRVTDRLRGLLQGLDDGSEFNDDENEMTE